MNNSVWKDKHLQYQAQDWIDKPSIFAEEAIIHFPHSGDLLELGAGLGQDSRFFAKSGYSVIATDIETTILDVDKNKVSPDIESRIQFQQLDLRQPFPIDDNSFQIVYAHLALHYFDKETTQKIFSEIHRVLKPHGIFAFLVNSTDDPEYGAGEVLEADYYMVDDKAKRFFSIGTVNELITDEYDILLLDNRGETYKDRDKGVHNLVRCVAKKKL
jgi:SAM-dependent methyltransferase